MIVKVYNLYVFSMEDLIGSNLGTHQNCCHQPSYNFSKSRKVHETSDFSMEIDTFSIEIDFLNVIDVDVI